MTELELQEYNRMEKCKKYGLLILTIIELIGCFGLKLTELNLFQYFISIPLFIGLFIVIICFIILILSILVDIIYFILNKFNKI